jgi:hypothetical protein
MKTGCVAFPFQAPGGEFLPAPPTFCWLQYHSNLHLSLSGFPAWVPSPSVPPGDSHRTEDPPRLVNLG